MSETVLSEARMPVVERVLVGLRSRLRMDAGEAVVAVRIAYVGIALYAALFVFAAVVHYLAYQTGRGDLGNMVQAIWNTLHGHFLEGTTLHGHQRDRLGFHVDPFLLLLAPLFWVWSSPLLLVIVQALAVSSGALPVFWLARKHLDSPRAGAQFALAYLLYPATEFSAFTSTSSFHSVAIAVPLVLYALWFLDEGRLVAFSAAALLACTTKEEIPLAVGCLGIWYAVRKGRRMFGVSVFAIGLALTLFNFLWVIPHFAPHGVNPFSGRYAAIGGTPGGIAHTFFTDPLAFLRAVATLNKALFLGLLLVPLLGLWLLEPLLLLGAVPDLAINLLSGKNVALASERNGVIVAFLVAGSIFGAARFKVHGERLTMWALLVTALLAFGGPLRFVSGDVTALGSPLVAVKARAVGLIPPRAPVSASNQLGGHLSQRRYIYIFPHLGRAKWAIVDANDPTYQYAGRYRRHVRELEHGGAWRTVFSSGGVVVLRRRH